MRTVNLWVSILLAAALGLAAVLFVIPRADAKDPDPAQAQALASVRAAMKMLMTTQEGAIPGMSKEEALPKLSRWSSIMTDFHTPLEGSPYALGEGVSGLVRVFVGKEGADDLSIHLFVSGVDRRRLREYVMEAGKELGYDMDDDSENPWSCSGSARGKRDMWIGVGVGLVSIEVNPPPM